MSLPCWVSLGKRDSFYGSCSGLVVGTGSAGGESWVMRLGFLVELRLSRRDGGGLLLE
ncbi:hypothetical protein [Pasteuria penetrans]|uniref:hypothetical protein n=1 Tax=Pasteuria penetrans TaxID=86005 RepID=UPI00165BEC73|nr:hypothetical protein [Pasteuria penetrans]